MKCTTIHNIYASTMMLLVGVDIFRTSSVWQRLGSIHLVGLHTHKFPNFRPTYPPRTQKIMTSLWQKYIGIRKALNPLRCGRTKWMAPYDASFVIHRKYPHSAPVEIIHIHYCICVLVDATISSLINNLQHVTIGLSVSAKQSRNQTTLIK